MRVLLVNQAYYPDESATAQYARDLAERLQSEGYSVTVVASNRGYLNPDSRYARFEKINNIHIHRVASPALPRRFKLLRMFDAFLLNICLLFKLYRLGSYDSTLCLTSPPLLGGFLGLYMPASKGRLIHWAMDINPDQAIRAGWIRERGTLARLLLFLQRNFYERCDVIIALDHFMKSLLLEKGIASEKIVVVPLWWSDDCLDIPQSAIAAFRDRYSISQKKVIMYAGNHSLCHSLDAMLSAALLLRSNSNYIFVFVGGGTRVREVTAWIAKHRLTNILQLPYQPRSELPALLAAADIQVVSCGERFVGVVHPSKVYPFLILNKPFILIGSMKSSVGDLIEAGAHGIVVADTDGTGFVTAMERLLATVHFPVEELVTKYRCTHVTRTIISLLHKS